MKLHRLASLLTLFALLFALSIPAYADTPLAAEARQLALLGRDGQPHDVSDAYAKAYILAHTGRQDVVDAMRARVPVQPITNNGVFFVTDTYSSEWGGYVSQMSSTYGHQVYGGFVDLWVEQTCSFLCGFQPLVGSWVGIGGIGNGQLLQAGANQRDMHAFWEGLPNSEQPLYGVNNGDHMWVYMSWDTSTSMWYLSVQDLTTSTYSTFEVSYTANRSTFEWITEVRYGGVPSMNPVPFATARWTDETGNGHTITDQANPYREILRDPSGGCIVPSGLSGQNDTFTNYTQGSC